MLGFLDSPTHLALLLVALLVLFGAKRLPEVGRSLGAGLRGFRDSVSGDAAAEPPEELPAPKQTVGDRAG